MSIPVEARAAPSNVSSDATVPASCTTTITPACLQALYGIPATPATHKTNTLGVSGFIDQFANSADLKVPVSHIVPLNKTDGGSQSFLTKLRTDMSSSTTFTLQTVDGGTNNQNIRDAGVEAVRASDCTALASSHDPVHRRILTLSILSASLLASPCSSSPSVRTLRTVSEVSSTSSPSCWARAPLLRS